MYTVKHGPLKGMHCMINGDPSAGMDYIVSNLILWCDELHEQLKQQERET